ncbi:hypothetical protein B0H11DRAFT_1915009 [Mycena galericulata]|nr:hypothetical protein B0H11DRAFT_1915009 [Mycena galericulata]
MIVHPPDPLMIRLFCPVPAFVDRRIPRLGRRLGKAHLAAAETIQGSISSGGTPANWILLDGNQSSIRTCASYQLPVYDINESLVPPALNEKKLQGALVEVTGGLVHHGFTRPKALWILSMLEMTERQNRLSIAYPLCFRGRFGKGEGHSGTAFGDTQKIRRPFPPPKTCKWPHD